MGVGLLEGRPEWTTCGTQVSFHIPTLLNVIREERGLDEGREDAKEALLYWFFSQFTFAACGGMGGTV